MNVALRHGRQQRMMRKPSFNPRATFCDLLQDLFQFE